MLRKTLSHPVGRESAKSLSITSLCPLWKERPYKVVASLKDSFYCLSSSSRSLALWFFPSFHIILFWPKKKVPSCKSKFLATSHTTFLMPSLRGTVFVLCLCQATSFWGNQSPIPSWFSPVAQNDSHTPYCHCWARSTFITWRGYALVFVTAKQASFWEDRLICQKRDVIGTWLGSTRALSFLLQQISCPASQKAHLIQPLQLEVHATDIHCNTKFTMAVAWFNEPCYWNLVRSLKRQWLKLD